MSWQARRRAEKAASSVCTSGYGLLVLVTESHAGWYLLRLLPGADPELLRPFAEDRYLHQTVINAGEGALAYADLPEALAAHPGPAAAEWRVHMHVPIFLEELGQGLATTRPFLQRVLQRVAPAVPVEVETYTFSVLPSTLRADTAEESIVRELQWVQGQRGTRNPDQPMEGEA